MESEYTSNDTPMISYINSSFIINEWRLNTHYLKSIGPKILITGSRSSGKSTLAKIFANYALRLGWAPILMDIDPLHNLIAPPACIAAAQIDFLLPVYIYILYIYYIERWSYEFKHKLFCRRY